MNCIENLNIRIKIMVPMFMIVILLFVTCGSSYLGLAKMKTAGEEISGNYAKSMSLLGDISTDVEALQRLAYSHCTATDYEMKCDVEKDIDEVSQLLLETCSNYETTLSSRGEERELYDQYKSKFDTFIGTFNTVITCSSSYQYTTAQSLANVELKAQGTNDVSKVLSNIIEITESIGGINLSIEESARCVNGATENLVSLVDSFAEVGVQMDENSAVAKSLKGESDNFKML